MEMIQANFNERAKRLEADEMEARSSFYAALAVHGGH